jgi:hypothetical protein
MDRTVNPTKIVEGKIQRERGFQVAHFNDR